MEGPSKKPCLRSCRSTPTAMPGVDVEEGAVQVTFKDLPQDHLVDIFLCMNLPTRLRLRRVCRSWKHTLLAPDSNVIISVDARCYELYFIRSTWPQSLSLLQQFISDTYLNGISVHPSGDRSTDASYVAALLGNHVRCVVYDGQHRGDHPPHTITALIPRNVRWLLEQTPHAEHLHLQHFNFIPLPVYMWHPTYANVLELFVKRDVAGGSDSLKTLTVTASEFGFCLADPISKGRSFKWAVHIEKLMVDLTVEDRARAIHDVVDPVVWPYPRQQIDWVAQHAPRLPERYINALHLILVKRDRDGGMGGLPTVNMKTLDYHSLDKEALLLLSRCIIDHKKKGTAAHRPPPFEFPADFLRESR